MRRASRDRSDALDDVEPVVLDRIMCQWCGRGSDGGGLGPTQGLDCAASVFRASEQTLFRVGEVIVVGDWYVQGHYPSDFDTTLHRFVRNPPTAKADPVCDACIRERLAAGDLEHVEGRWL